MQKYADQCEEKAKDGGSITKNDYENIKASFNVVETVEDLPPEPDMTEDRLKFNKLMEIFVHCKKVNNEKQAMITKHAIKQLPNSFKYQEKFDEICKELSIEDTYE